MASIARFEGNTGRVLIGKVDLGQPSRIQEPADRRCRTSPVVVVVQDLSHYPFPGSQRHRGTPAEPSGHANRRQPLRLRRLLDPRAATSGRIPASFGCIATGDRLVPLFRGMTGVRFQWQHRRASRDRVREGNYTSDLDLRGFYSFARIPRFAGYCRGES